RLGAVRRDPAQRKKTVPLSREELPDLLRKNRRRYQSPSCLAQEHASRFSVPQQTASFRGRAIGRSARVLELDRGRRANAQALTKPSRQTTATSSTTPNGCA